MFANKSLIRRPPLLSTRSTSSPYGCRRLNAGVPDTATTMASESSRSQPPATSESGPELSSTRRNSSSALYPNG